MSVRTRLYVASTLIILVLIAPAIYALRQLSELRDIAFDLNSRHAVAFLTVGRLQTAVAELNRLQRTYVVAPDSTVHRDLLEQLAGANRHLDQLAESGYAQQAAREGVRIDSLGDATAHLDSLIREGLVDEATVYFQDVKPIYTRAQESLAGLAGIIDARSGEAAARAAEISAAATTTAATGLAIALAFALLLGIVNVSALISPLRRLRAAMAAVAGGRFAPPEDLPYGRPDEIGDLSRSFLSMTQQLAELDRLKAEFVGIASHELKTPVSVIRGYAEMLDDGFYGELEPKQREILSFVREQTDVLTERVNELLSVSRLEAGGLEIEVSEVRTAELIRDVQQTFGALAAQKSIELSIEATDSAPEVTIIDGDRVRNELLGNLLSNAFKFTPRGGRITLRVSGDPGLLLFEIVDTGEGIPTAQQPFIFEKYYQAGTHAGKVGSGLGLAIAREIVEAHGGSIHAESEPGAGTTFRVALPAGQGETSDSPGARPENRTGSATDAGHRIDDGNGLGSHSAAAPTGAALGD